MAWRWAKSNYRSGPNESTEINLRRRCQSCHGQDPGSIFTFLINVGPKAPPEVHGLPPADDGHARFVAQEKMKRADFGSLHPPN
jgi:hypothetical protein